MINFSKLFIAAVLGVVATGATAEPIACKGCYPKEQEISHREQIKADRARYDRENEKITARPWDLKKDNKPLPDKKEPAAVR
jgi:hypothetical protein